MLPPVLEITTASGCMSYVQLMVSVITLIAFSQRHGDQSYGNLGILFIFWWFLYIHENPFLGGIRFRKVILPSQSLQIHNNIRQRRVVIWHRCDLNEFEFSSIFEGDIFNICCLLHYSVKTLASPILGDFLGISCLVFK